MSNQHPYPRKVVEAVAKALWDIAPASAVLDWEDIQPEDTANRRSDYLEKAEAALQALWDASEVRTFGDLAGLPGTAIIANQQGQTSSLNDFLGIQEVGSPAHVIYWGNDDR